MIKKAPYWKDTLIFSIRDLNNASLEQKQFYALLKTEFLNDNCLDINNNSNYAFVLLFDLAEDFKQHKDYDLLYKQYKILSCKYPITLKYVNSTLIESLCSYEGADFKDIPIIKSITQILNNEMQSTRFLLKPIDWVLSLVRYERSDEKNLYLRTLYQVAQILHKMGFEIIPTDEIDSIRLNFGDVCVIYKNIEGYKISKTREIELANTFIKLSAYIIQANEVNESDYDFIDEYIKNQSYGINTSICNHLMGAYRWHILCKKQRLDKNVKNPLNLFTSTDQRKKIGKAMIQLACTGGEIQHKRIDRIKQILPILGIKVHELNNIISNLSDCLRKSQKTKGYIECVCANEQQAKDNSNNNSCALMDKKYDERLIGTLIDTYRKKGDVSSHPILQDLITDLTKELSTNRFVVKSIDWIFKFFNYSPVSSQASGIRIYEIKEILSSLGLGVLAGELDQIYGLQPNGICVIYDIFSRYVVNESHLKNKTKKQFEIEKRQDFLIRRMSGRARMYSVLRQPEYKFILLYIQLITKVIQEDELLNSDYQIIDKFILEFNNSINYEGEARRFIGISKINVGLTQEFVKQYLQAYARLFIFSKKQIFSASMKKYIETEFNSIQCNSFISALIHLACSSGNIRTNRIKSLEKILPAFRYDVKNIHSDIHRILTDIDEFETIEKTSNASEYSIYSLSNNEQQSNMSHSVLDARKLSDLERQTQEARDILSDIFIEDSSEENRNNTMMQSLNTWKDILRQLSTKEVWKREEAENICNDNGLILGAVLEQINDIAYEEFEDAVVEDDGDNVYINLDYIQGLL